MCLHWTLTDTCRLFLFQVNISLQESIISTYSIEILSELLRHSYGKSFPIIPNPGVKSEEWWLLAELRKITPCQHHHNPSPGTSLDSHSSGSHVKEANTETPSETEGTIVTPQIKPSSFTFQWRNKSRM